MEPDHPPKISRRTKAAMRVLDAIENPSDKALKVIEKASDQAISDGAILYGIRQGWVTLEVVHPEENRPGPQASPETPPEPYVSPTQRWRQQRREEEIRTAQEVAERQRQQMGWPLPPDPTISRDRQQHGSKLYGWSAEEWNETFEPWPEEPN